MKDRTVDGRVPGLHAVPTLSGSAPPYYLVRPVKPDWKGCRYFQSQSRRRRNWCNFFSDGVTITSGFLVLTLFK